MTYDSTSDGVFTYQYNYAGRMVSVNNGSTATYGYDGRGLRVSEDAYSNWTYLYDLSGRPITEAWPDDGLWTISNVYLNGRPLARIDTDYGIPREDTARLSFYYYHLDHLGTPLAMTDGDKHPVWGTQYLPFGETYNTSSFTGFGNDFRFPGQVHDGETDLHYKWHRYYKPQLGRYIQADPWGYSLDDANLYAYAGSNPIRISDPLGLQTKRNWWELLGEGYYYGTGYGEEALDYWAGVYSDPETHPAVKPFAWALGHFSALWLPENYMVTATSLAAAGGAQTCGLAARGPWLGSVQLHTGHLTGPHTYPHLQMMIRVATRGTPPTLRLPPDWLVKFWRWLRYAREY